MISMLISFRSFHHDKIDLHHIVFHHDEIGKKKQQNSLVPLNNISYAEIGRDTQSDCLTV